MDLGLILSMAKAADPDRIAIRVDEATLSVAEVVDGAERGAEHLRGGGHRALIYVGEYSTAFATMPFAAALAGVPFVPLNYRLSERQLADQLADHESPVIVADNPETIVSKAGAEVITPLQWLQLSRRSHLIEGEREADSAAVLLYTSGTTSRPKAVSLGHHHLTSYVLETVEFSSADPGEVALVSVPPYHIAGLMNLLTNFYAGRPLVVLPRFDPQAWVDTVLEQRVTQALVVPTMLSRIVDLLEANPTNLPHLKRLAYGGSRVSRKVLEGALRAFPQVDFVQAYGLTETSSTVSILGPDDHRNAVESEDERIRRRLESVGHPIPGIEVQIRDSSGEVLQPEEDGRIWLRGAQVSGTYRDGDSALDGDGWFDTRDRGHLDEDGYLFVIGRDDKTIIRGGENVAPAEIEAALAEHPDVEGAVVIGLPDHEWGERIVAAVSRRPGSQPGEAELRDWVRDRLRSSKTPDEVHVWSELPIGDTGKIQRTEVVTRLVRSERSQRMMAP